MLQGAIGQKHKLILGLVFAVIFFCYVPPLKAAPDDVKDAEFIKEAQKEGKVVFYGSLPVADTVVIVDKFQKKYPFIKVDLVPLHNAQILNRVLAEQKAKKNTADVVNLKGDVIHLMQKMGLLARYLSPERKFFADGFKDKEGYWTDLYPTVLSVVYNTRMVSPQEVPMTYQDLLKPQWKGKIGFNPLQYMWSEAVMQIMGKDEGLKYMEALARQNLIVRESGTLNVMLTAAGEIAMALPINADRIWAAKAKGAPVDWARLKPYFGDLHPLAMAANAPHPHAGKLFIDFCLSDGQELMNASGYIPARKGLKSPIRSEEIVTMDPVLGEKTVYYQKLVRTIFSNKLSFNTKSKSQ